MIARFLANEGLRLRAYQPPTPEQRQIDQLLRRRSKIVTLKTALQLTCSDAPCLRTETARLLKSFAALLKQIDQQLATLQQAMPERAQQLERLQSIPGVGPLTACWLANLLDRVPFANSDALVAFTGMDPQPCDSQTYEHCRERGWTMTEAIVIFARKMLRIALAMHKTQKCFDAQFVGKTA
ncbi:transposase [Noviherbaspirillum sp. L7-7A]|uniref:transposase n=1 Tax=Noviherbaspirillum sp. L7-7A TaxID=2850560 RepID=UPI001C2C71A8|nr:transposase [Noviherbaspirillum sp. L7-7A]MBV0881890.1 transposase [Noviherbaspirillum sp. L7-7A]